VLLKICVTIFRKALTALSEIHFVVLGFKQKSIFFNLESSAW
jgi:hypothetical protein